MKHEEVALPKYVHIDATRSKWGRDHGVWSGRPKGRISGYRAPKTPSVVQWRD